MTVQGTQEMSGTGTSGRNSSKGNQWTEVRHSVCKLKGFSSPAHATSPSIKLTPHLCGTVKLCHKHTQWVQKLISQMCEELYCFSNSNTHMASEDTFVPQQGGRGLVRVASLMLV